MDLKDLHLHWGGSSYKGRNYRSYSLARSYRKNGKNRKEPVIKLGKLSDQEANRWRNYLIAIKNPDYVITTPKEIVVIGHFAYLDVATANAVWDYWRLDEVFQDNGKRNVGIATIARILALNRCIDPASKSQTPEWFNRTSLHWLLDVDRDEVNASRIFRELDVIEDHKEAMSRHLFKQMIRNDPEGMKSVFYDLSSTTFHGSRCVLMKWGHCKEGYRNHVVLAMVVNRDGLPFYWEVLPGGTADATTITWLLERLKERFKLKEITLVFDRGMVSDDNLTLLEEVGIKYISAMDKSQLETITGLNFTIFSHREPEQVDVPASQWPGFGRLNDGSYYREIKVEGQRRFILCFNPQLFKDQRQTRNQAVVDFHSFVNNLNDQLRRAKKSRQRKPTYEKFKRQLTKSKLTGFVDVELRVTHINGKTPKGTPRKIRTYCGTVVVDEEERRLAGRFDGFWLLVTNHKEKEGDTFKLSAPEAVSPYRDKVVIESAFRDIKSFVEVAPIYVWTEAHVKAHYTICVLSHLINRTLTLRLHKCKGDKTREIVAHEKLYAKLSDCQIDWINIENAGLSTYNMTRPTTEQKELLNRIGLSHLISGDVVEKVISLR